MFDLKLAIQMFDKINVRYQIRLFKSQRNKRARQRANARAVDRQIE